jgi:hypothetical protein
MLPTRLTWSFFSLRSPVGPLAVRLIPKCRVPRGPHLGQATRPGAPSNRRPIATAHSTHTFDFGRYRREMSRLGRQLAQHNKVFCRPTSKIMPHLRKRNARVGPSRYLQLIQEDMGRADIGTKQQSKTFSSDFRQLHRGGQIFYWPPRCHVRPSQTARRPWAWQPRLTSLWSTPQVFDGSHR